MGSLAPAGGAPRASGAGMGDLDLAAKVVLREDPGAVLALVCPGMGLAPVRIADAEQVRLHRFLDGLVEVDAPGVGRGFVHVEFAASWKSDLPDRELEYYLLARRNHRPLLPVVLCLKPGDRQAKPPDQVTVVDGFGSWEVNRFRFLVVRLWELPASVFLATPALAALAPFAAGASEATVDRAMRVIEGVEPETRRWELKAALALLASNVFPTKDWVGRIPLEILMATSFSLIVERNFLARLLQVRLKEDAAGFVARLSTAPEEAIEQAGSLVATVHSDPELIAALDALLPRE